MPKTAFGKIFTTFYIFFGVGIITAFISYNLRRTAVRYERKHVRSPRTSKAPKA